MENIWRKTFQHLRPQESGSVRQRIRLGGFLSFSDGYQHWHCLWEKRPRREGSFQSQRFPWHAEAAEHRDHRAQRAEQHQAVRLLLPQHQRERPVPGLGPERTQITAEVGFHRAAGGHTQVLVPAQPGSAALPGAARFLTPELPLARCAVLFLPRRAAQHMCLVVCKCGECYIYLHLLFTSWVFFSCLSLTQRGWLLLLSSVCASVAQVHSCNLSIFKQVFCFYAAFK